MADWARVRAAEEREMHDLERFCLEISISYTGDQDSKENKKAFKKFFKDIEKLFELEPDGRGYGGKEVSIDFPVEKPSTVRKLIRKTRKYREDNEYGTINEEELKGLK